MMKISILNEIVTVLNDNNLKEQEKKNIIYQMRKGKHIENRQLLFAIDEIMSYHILPITHKESLHGAFINNMSERNFMRLEEITKNSKCKYFNAVASELLWQHNHDLSLAKKALDLYYDESKKYISNDEIEYVRFAVSICRIYSRCAVSEFPYDSFFDEAIAYIKTNFPISNYCILFILEALSTCNRQIDIIESVYNEAILFYENSGDFSKANSFLESLEEFYESHKKNGQKSNLRRRMAVNYERQADALDWESPENAHRIVSHIQSAMEMWNKANDSDSPAQRKRLAKRIDPIKKLSLKAMHIISSDTIDLTDWINETRQFLLDSSLELAIYRLSEMVKLESYDEIEKRVKSSKAFSSYFFSSIVLDSEGRKKCVIPSMLNATKAELSAIFERDASLKYETFANIFIKRYIILAKEKFDFTKETLSFLLEDNIFVQPNRKESYINGMISGFNFDFTTAMHLLMPQIEHGIRCLAQECGAVVYKTLKTGVEECLSLESILKLPEVEECFDEVFLFNLKLFFTSDFGFGMRNIVSHGLYSDNELCLPSGIAVWWFAFHICCMFSPKLAERIHLQMNTKALES